VVGRAQAWATTASSTIRTVSMGSEVVDGRFINDMEGTATVTVGAGKFAALSDRTGLPPPCIPCSDWEFLRGAETLTEGTITAAYS